MKIFVTKRQFELLSILERENDWRNSDELGAMLDLSNKTIQKEIRMLNELMPKNWKIHMSIGLGYMLEQPISESVKFKYIVEEELLYYDALKLITNKEATNLTDLSEKLYLSLSSVHKLLRNLNKGIKRIFNVEIIDIPLRLSGTEIDMRRLLYDMNYFINSRFNNLELFLIEKKKLDIFITTEIRINISLYNRNMFYTFLETSIKRIKEGFKAEILTEDLVLKATSTDLYRRIKPLFTYIEELYDVKLSLNERFILYYDLIQTDFHLIESYDPDFFKEDNQLNHSFLTFVDYLSEIFKLNFRASRTFMITAFNLYYLNSYVIDLITCNSFQGQDYYDQAISKHNLPIDTFTKLCTEWGYKNDVKFSKHVITSLLILIQEYNLTQAQVNVFVVKSHSFILNHLLMTELKREFGHKINFLEYEPSYLRNFNEFTPEVDLILSNILLPNKFSSIPYIYLSEYVTDKKLNLIRNKINNLIKVKEKLILNIPPEIKVSHFVKK